MIKSQDYNEKSIQSLEWNEHIRMRPGMYIGKLGNGSHPDDGIYVLIKEVIDNSIDEYVMGNGKKIDVKITDSKVVIRDYGRGIPLGKLKDCITKINTGAKYDSEVFKKSVGLNGVGIKAVNALSTFFTAESIRDGKVKKIDCEKGIVVNDNRISKTTNRNGTKITFIPDSVLFDNFSFDIEYVKNKIKNYTYLNSGLVINLNGEKIYSDNGLLDLLKQKTKNINLEYPIIHLVEDDMEIAITHGNNYGEEYYTFVNGQHTTQGGTHLSAFKESYVKTIRDFYKKDFDVNDIRSSIIAAVSVRINNPVFESQTKTKLGSTDVDSSGLTLRVFFNDFMKSKLDNFLHKNEDSTKKLLNRILQSEKERKEILTIKKASSKIGKKAKVHNKKLRECKIHLNDKRYKEEQKEKSSIFITEGDSASGSITKARDVLYQAVFSLRGKPLNTFGMRKKIVYENEEFNLLQHALNIEDGLENLRYNKIIIATDADVDGMHIRLLLLTFFLQFYIDVVRNNHLFILETPLFRVRNKNNTIYCYSEEEKKKAVDTIGKINEITRFKGLGEISPSEFKYFINEDIRLQPIQIDDNLSVDQMLSYYMGKNTIDRQDFIIKNLVHLN